MVSLLANCQVFGTWELGDFHSEDSVWICHTICFFRHKVNINNLSNFHVSYSRIKSSDHLACAADEFQRFATIVRGIKLCSIIESSSVMCAAGFSYIASCKLWL